MGFIMYSNWFHSINAHQFIAISMILASILTMAWGGAGSPLPDRRVKRRLTLQEQPPG